MGAKISTLLSLAGADDAFCSEVPASTYICIGYFVVMMVHLSKRVSELQLFTVCEPQLAVRRSFFIWKGGHVNQSGLISK